MSSRKVISNVIKEEHLRQIQLNTLEVLSTILKKSFGVMGSNTIIKKDDTTPIIYTKDGHTILRNVQFDGSVENGVRNDVEDITRHIVKKVGDGTTSAVILSHLIFKYIDEYQKENPTIPPSVIVRTFNDVVSDVSEHIRKNTRPITLDSIRDIAMISTNGNEEIANDIYNIYKEYGFDVYIDPISGIDTNNIIKEYDGMYLDAGYIDRCFINDNMKNVCAIRNPRIYAFADPVDTPEMAALLNSLIQSNIYDKAKNKENMIPTVILTKMISRDLSSYMKSIIKQLYDYPGQIPILIICGINDEEKYNDIIQLCGCKPIYKYINAEIQMKDIEEGKAPTPETVSEFYGEAELVESDNDKTKFINPSLMRDKDGEYSETFKKLVAWLETELDHAMKNTKNLAEVARIKKRINSLKSNLVEFYVGGISASDRDSKKDLIDDAVLNCRSAARYGVGWGANVQGYLAISELYSKHASPNTDIEVNYDVYINLLSILLTAYEKILGVLYSTVIPSDKIEKCIKDIKENETPMNLATKEFDGTVLSSIESDPEILNAIAKIITLMVTSNQFVITDIKTLVPYFEYVEQL